MTTDLNQKINQRFDFSYDQQSELTKRELMVLERKLNLNDLLLDDRIVILDQANKLSDQEMISFQWQDYLSYAGDKEALRIIFHDNCLFYHDREEHKMQQAISVFEKNRLLKGLIKETHALYPVFPIDSYQRSDNNAVFYLLNQQPTGTTNEDYLKMISCQSRSLSECVFALSLQLRERFNQCLEPGLDFLRKAKNELKLVRTLLDQNSSFTVTSFFSVLSQLKAMDGLILPPNQAQLFDSFFTCLSDPHQPCRFSPRYFQQCLHEINSGQLPDCCLLCLALIRYEAWLNDLSYGMISENDHPELCYDRLFYTIVKESMEEALQVIDQSRNEYPPDTMTAMEYEKVILSRLAKIKITVDQIKVVDYYHFLEDIEMVKCCFINNCMESKDVDYHTGQLKNVLITYSEIRYWEHELLSIGKGIKAAVQDILELNRTLSLVLARMVPNRQIVIKTKAAFEKAMNALQEGKPLIYVLEDLTADFEEIFEMAVDNLFLLFEEQPYDESLIYANRCIRDIQFMQYKAQTRGLSFNEYYSRLETILKFQINYLSFLPHTHSRTRNPKHDTDVSDKNADLSFGFDGDETWLLSVYKGINKHYHFLDPRTTMDTFLRVMTSKNFMEEEEKIYIGCHTNIFKCIMDASKPSFKKLTNANMGRSGLFISHLKNTISEDNLKGSHLKNQEIIRHIGSFFCLKHN